MRHPRIALLTSSPADRALIHPLKKHIPRAFTYSLDMPSSTPWNTAAMNWEQFLARFNHLEGRALAPRDILVLAGDRHETLCFATWGRQLGCRIFHIGGGDTLHATRPYDTCPDHVYRDAISMLAQRHYVANETAYLNLLCLIGTQAEGVVKITGLPSLDRVFAAALDFYFMPLLRVRGEIIFVMHSNPGKEDRGWGDYLRARECVVQQQRIGAVTKVHYSLAGADAGGIEIDNSLRERDWLPPELRAQWVQITRDPMGMEFVRLMQVCEYAVGNSSAFLLEAGLFGLKCVLFGDRQAGRLIPPHIIPEDQFPPDPRLVGMRSNHYGHPDGQAAKEIGEDICRLVM